VNDTKARQDMHGSLNFTIAELARESQALLARPQYLDQAEALCGREIVQRAQDAAARITTKRLTARDLEALYLAELDARARLAGIEPSPELKATLWSTYASVLGAEAPDHEADGAEYEEAVELLIRAEERRERLKALPRCWTGAELLNTDFPAPRWIVPDLLCEGLSLLVGAPKLGKSWLALSLCSAVSTGGAVLGRYRVDPRAAVYIAYEDPPRRLADRLRMIGAGASANLLTFAEWRRGAEGVADLDALLASRPDVALCVIDTLGRFRGPKTSEDAFAQDYAEGAALKTLADRYHVALVVVHHTRKQLAEDVLDSVSGTNALNGAADATMVLRRTRGEGDASLFVVGREVAEQDLALKFNSTCGTWTVLGDSAEYQQTQERRDILAALRSIGRAAKTKEIAEAVRKSVSTVSHTLAKLLAEGLVSSPSYGVYTIQSLKSVQSGKYKQSHFERIEQFEDPTPPAGEAVE
jgi:RecA-family ATPase